MPPSSRTSLLPIPAALAGCALFFLVLGTVHFLDLSSVLDPELVFGDDGDGFFNLWVLLHNRDTLGLGLTTWADGRIFWPENAKTLFWSDILLAPTLPFVLLSKIGFNDFTAYRLTAMGLSAAMYLAILLALLFFHRWQTGTTARPALPVALLLPAVAFVLSFSINQMTVFQHFQNLCWLLLVPLLLGLTGFSCRRRRRWLVLALTAQVLLMISAPYFAVMGVILFGLWFLLHLGRHGIGESLRDLARTWPLWVTAGALCLVPAWLYHSVEHPLYRPALIHAEYASRLFHLWTPRQGLIHELLSKAGVALPRISHESPAWLGPGMLLLLAGILVPTLGDLARTLPRRLLAGLTAGILLCGFLEPVVREQSFPAGLLLAWTTLLLGLTLAAAYLRGKVLRGLNEFPAAFMLAAALTSLGLALGPSSHYNLFFADPSLHGILSRLVPGLGSMRAVGRMMLVAQFCLAAWLLLEYGRLWKNLARPGRAALAVSILLALLLQGMDAWPVRAGLHRFPVQRLQARGNDLALLSRLRGSGCVFPTRPWHRNTHPMLYLRPARNLILVNGYSGRSSRLLDQLMALAGQEEEPTDAQLALLSRRGCTYIMVWKRKISRQRLHILAQRYPLSGETDQMMIFSLNGRSTTPRNAPGRRREIPVRAAAD